MATTGATVGGNLPSDAANGTILERDVPVYGADGKAGTLTLTFEKTALGWNVKGSDGAAVETTALTFVNGALTGGTLTPVGGITVDLSGITGFAALSTVAIEGQNGRQAGTLESFTLSKDGTLVGLFSNGAKEPIARVALATFANPGGLEKTGSSGYRATVNSGNAAYGVPGDAGFGVLAGGQLEMSNVDLSQEFTNLIVAQRGFQANARIITTSDEVLQELTNLKR